MGAIVKLAENKYVEWSGITDSPVTGIMDKETMEDFVRGSEEEADRTKCDDPKVMRLRQELIDLKVKNRLERLEKNGHTSMAFPEMSAKEYVAGNRAGKGEKTISLEEIIELYTYTPENKGKFPWT